jgi:enamine deaminase RidA (YjgF/YER057c/UK114 family)
MRIPCACLLLLIAHGALAAGEPPSREHLAPAGWEGSYHQLHYSPVVKIGERVLVSGIPALEGDSEEAKIRWAFQQLRLHLEQAGATMEDVVELTSFHVAGDPAEFRARLEPVLRVHREFFKDHYPAWTAVGTSALYSADAPMELRAEAIIGSGRAARSEIPPPAPPSTSGK